MASRLATIGCHLVAKTFAKVSIFRAHAFCPKSGFGLIWLAGFGHNFGALVVLRLGHFSGIL